MKYKTPYSLEKNLNTYHVFNKQGRLLIYIKIEKSCNKRFDWRVIESNIDFDFINNAVVKYCVSKIESNILDSKRTELYLNLIIERVLSDQKGHRMFIDSYFLNKQGKFQPALYAVYQRIKKQIGYAMEDSVEVNVPYTISTHHFLFDIINEPVIQEGIIKKSVEVTKAVFENFIPNEKVGLAYIDSYNSGVVFYQFLDENDVTYFMVLENKMVMFFELALNKVC